MRKSPRRYSATPVVDIKGSLVAAHNTLLPGENGSLRPVSEVQFAQDVADMPFDCVLANYQLPGNVAVAQPIGDQFEDLHLAPGQLGERVNVVRPGPM